MQPPENLKLLKQQFSSAEAGCGERVNAAVAATQHIITFSIVVIFIFGSSRPFTVDGRILPHSEIHSFVEPVVRFGVLPVAR
jgi:hypothetical protein